MSKAWKQVMRTCNSKKKLDKKGAITAKNWAWNNKRLKLGIYKCPTGDHWHLTSHI
jgi:hypothetical protein